MMKKIKIISNAAFVVIVIFALLTGQYFLIMGAIATAFAANAAFMSDDPNQNYNEKNRSVAMALSKIPCAGQFYLNDRRKAIMFLSVYPTILALLVLMFEFRTDALYIFGNFIAFVFFSGVASMIDVEISCNMRHLPYLNNARELRIKDYRKAYVMLVFFTLLFVAVITAYGLLYFDENNVWIYFITSLIWTLGAFFTLIKTRNGSR